MDHPGWRPHGALLNPDVLILGAGTAGAAAAAACARRGMRVRVLEAGPLETAGAHWFNGVPAWAFDAVGLDRPKHPECAAEGVPFHLVVGWGPERLVVRNHDLMEVDMALLVQRLRGQASKDGAEFHGDTRVGPEVLDTVDCPVIDATGLSGLNLLALPPVPREDLCVAAQGVWQVDDVQAARGWFSQHAAPEGETLCFTGVAGGYSVVNLRLEGDALSMLTGSIPALGHPSGPLLAQRFADEHAWVGQRLRFGARALPLAPPPITVGRGRVAAIGDAARQVFGAHGSGIAQQLLAAEALAQALADGSGPEGYARRWRRQHGGLLAGADTFRRFSCTLSSEDLLCLTSQGILSEDMARQTLTQRPPRPSPALAKAVWGLAKNPGLARRMVPVLARLPLLEASYRLGR